jgi:hypothetical protein
MPATKLAAKTFIVLSTEAKHEMGARERPKIETIACPWLIAGFIAEQIEFLYLLAVGVVRITQETDAVP